MGRYYLLCIDMLCKHAPAREEGNGERVIRRASAVVEYPPSYPFCPKTAGVDDRVLSALGQCCPRLHRLDIGQSALVIHNPITLITPVK